MERQYVECMMEQKKSFIIHKIMQLKWDLHRFMFLGLQKQMLFMRCAYESQVEHLTIFPFPGLKIINIRGETILTFSECFNFMFQATPCSHLT